MSRLGLSFKKKLLIGIAASIFLVFGAGSVVASWLIESRLQEQTRRQMDVTGQGIHAMVRSLVVNAIKNYLKGVSETNLAYVQFAYDQFKSGKISQPQAQALAESFMLRQRIGSSGYVTAVDISGGGIKLAVHPHFKGRGIEQFPFAHDMAKQRDGYLEFEWKNPGDQKPRMKSEWMSYFEPWQWIVNAAPFRDEYPQLVDLEGIESELAKVDVQGQGYAFIMDLSGNLLAHPTWKGQNMIDAIDVKTGQPFVRQMIEKIVEESKRKNVEGIVGNIDYHLADPKSGQIFARMMNYRFVPEVNWVVGIVTDLDQVMAPLSVVRQTQFFVLVASLALSLIVVIWAVRPMTRSIDDLAKAVEGIDGGNLDTPLPRAGNDEIGKLASAFGRMAERLARYTEDLEQRVAERTAELQEANLKLARLSNTDGLTGIANRRKFDEMLAAEWARACRTSQTMALILLDVDFFKKYNDHYGHQAGDECLKNVGQVLSVCARRATDFAARYGGEEFVMIAADSNEERACQLAQSVRQSIEALAIPHEQSPMGHVTVSLGVAVVTPLAGQSFETLLRQADEALYRAKNNGRNRIEVADPSV
jgi:diguanylate cyclase (GGDEF)-like protein